MCFNCNFHLPNDPWSMSSYTSRQQPLQLKFPSFENAKSFMMIYKNPSLKLLSFTFALIRSEARGFTDILSLILSSLLPKRYFSCANAVVRQKAAWLVISQKLPAERFSALQPFKSHNCLCLQTPVSKAQHSLFLLSTLKKKHF